MAKNSSEFPIFGLLFGFIAVPLNFLIGFVVGVGAPIAAIAGIVAGIRLLTNKVPFLDQAEDADGDTILTLKLVPAEDAVGLYTEEKDRLAGELGGFQTEIKAIIEEAQAQGAPEADVEVEVVIEEEI